MSDPVDQATNAHHSIQEAQYNDYVAIRDRLLEYYEPSEVDLWIRAPHPQLEGQSALLMITRGEPDKVHAIIDRLDSGTYL